MRLEPWVVLLLSTTIFTAARAQTATAPFSSTASEQSSHEVDIDASKQWVDTKIDLRGSEKLRFTATGTMNYPQGASSKSQTPQSFGPQGLARGFRDLIRQYPVADGGHGALIGRLGSADTSQPFLVGTGREFTSPVAGRLFLGINQSLKDASTAQGSFHVTIEILDEGSTAGASAVAGGPSEAPIAGVTTALFSEIPRRVSDAQGDPGDMVNILIIGREDQLVAAFKAAGWVRVDSSVGSTVVAGLMASLSKESYLTMPMSTLYLFNRPQDYGFAHAEPVRVVMSRNHLRVWKSPQVVNGSPVWCVAATHDIGLERDQRNNGVTHKIDPDIDAEREYVNGTLSSTGLVTARDHVTPADALREAKTATGGSFRSDGRILVLLLGTTASPMLSNSQPLLDTDSGH